MTATENLSPPSTRSLMLLLRRHRVLIVGLATVGALAAIGVSLLQTPSYSASASLSFRDVSQDLGLLGTSAATLNTSAALAAASASTLNSPDVVSSARQALHTSRSVSDLQNAVSATAQPDSNLVVVTAHASDAGFAAGFANAVADAAAVAANTEARQRYQRAAASLSLRVKRLPRKRRDSATRAAYANQISRLDSLSLLAQPAQVVKLAQQPASPSSPKPAFNAVLGLVFGLLLGLMASFLHESLTRSLRGAEEISAAVDMPLLGRVSEWVMGRTPFLDPTPDQPTAEALEGFAILRRNVELLTPKLAPRIVAVTSAVPEEGKTTVAISLACALVSAARRTLLVECDLRRATFVSRMGLEDGPGLAEFLTNRAEQQDVLHTLALPTATAAGDSRHLGCITAGVAETRPDELLASKRFAEFLASVSGVYDCIVLDTPPLLPVVDTREFLPLVDAILFCVRAGQTTRAQVAAAVESLARLPAKPSGVIATGLWAREDEDLAYSTYGYVYTAPSSN